MSFLSNNQDEVMSEINMTPLVDVMLVLLIIFIITMPVINHAVKLDLPKASNQVNDTRPKHINLSIQADKTIVWDNEVISSESLKQKLSLAAQQPEQPEVHLRADQGLPYGEVVKIMAMVQKQGMQKIGFVTEAE